MSTESLLNSYVKEYRAKSSSSAVGLDRVLGADALANLREKLSAPFPKISISIPPADGLAFTVPKRSAGASCLPALSRTQRLLGFGFTFSAGVISLALASLYIPVLLLKAQKFGALYAFGSMFFLLSFAILLGPVSFAKYLFSRERLCLTVTYFTSLLGTLYYSVWLKSTPLTVLLVSVQIFSLIWFVLTYIPGGEKGLHLFTSWIGKVVKGKLCSKSSSSAGRLPV